jgi:hypothetical protein
VIPEPLAEFLVGFPIWAIALVVSGRFFREKPAAPLPSRLVASAHGVLIAVAYAFACFASRFTQPSSRALNQPYEISFVVLLVAALLSVVGSIVVLGRRRVLLYHLITVPVLVAAAFLGELILSHDSL